MGNSATKFGDCPNLEYGREPSLLRDFPTVIAANGRPAIGRGDKAIHSGPLLARRLLLHDLEKIDTASEIWMCVNFLVMRRTRTILCPISPVNHAVLSISDPLPP
jgi:hypothetical protein